MEDITKRPENNGSVLCQSSDVTQILDQVNIQDKLHELFLAMNTEPIFSVSDTLWKGNIKRGGMKVVVRLSIEEDEDAGEFEDEEESDLPDEDEFYIV